MPTVADIASDLAAEHADLDALVSSLAPDQWLLPTPSPGWTIADQVGHLGFFDHTATLAITDPTGFREHATELVASLGEGSADPTLDEARTMEPGELLRWWRTARSGLIEAAASLDDESRLPWYGPPMSAKSFLTARLMETWAHGQEVYDQLGVEREDTDRIHGIATLGVKTFGWTFINRKMEVPQPAPYVRLIAPSGAIWEWNEPQENNRVEGSATEFCQVVTQTRNFADTKLVAVGNPATRWMSIAQCFAGPPEDPPKPGTRHIAD